MNAASESYQFFCPQCQTLLEVPREMAGVTGPCPSCGSVITSPAVPGIPRLDTETSPLPAPTQPRPVELRPRELRRPEPAPAQGPPAAAADPPDTASPRVHRARSVNPRTGISEMHREKQELVIILKMLLALALAAAAVALVYFYVRYRI